jgi:hypothetical protein
LNIVSVSVTIKSLKEEKAAASIRYKKIIIISFVFKQDAVASPPSCSNQILFSIAKTKRWITMVFKMMAAR